VDAPNTGHGVTSQLYDQLVAATVAANRRAEAAEARCQRLEDLLDAQQISIDRAENEANALYNMLPEDIRPTT
jgi:HPt (histidine-containing phosphotransfer) domain-containing protein